MPRSLAEYRRDQFRVLRAERVTRIAVPLLALAGLAGGILLGRNTPGEHWSLPLAGAILAPLAYLGLRVGALSERARVAYLTDWGGEHGFAYTNHPTQHDEARFMRQGHDGKFLEAFQRQQAEGDVEVANFRYLEGSGRSERTINLLTAAVTCATPGVLHLSLAPRGFLSGGLLDSLESAFTSDRAIQLESAEFADKFQLMVDDAADEVDVRTLFTPKVITGLLDAPGARFEVCDGVLWVWEEGRFVPDDMGVVTDALDRALDLRGRLLGERRDAAS
jgi:hypothetical protein